MNFCGPGESQAETRHKAGVSYQLPAWPGTTTTSSSCSSSVTAVSRCRGCETGSGPFPVFDYILQEGKKYCSTRLLCVCCTRLLRFASHFYTRKRVKRKPPPCFSAIDGAEVSRLGISGRIPPPWLQSPAPTFL